MQKVVACLALAVALSGCGAGVALLLSESARDDLVETFQASVDAQQMLSEHVFALARGDVDISQYDYTPPVGDQPGRLSISDAPFPFGTGTLVLDFTVVGDSGPVDPYAAGVDLRQHSQIDVDADFTFVGTSVLGYGLNMGGDVTVTTMQNSASTATAVVDGTFGIDHNDYTINLASRAVEMNFDMAQRRVTNVVGQVDGSLDIPDFFYDASFVVDGIGTQLQVGIDAVVDRIDYVVDIF